MLDFKQRTESIRPGILRFEDLHTLQMNLGNLCNQACEHCHVEAGPHGKNIMQWRTMDMVVEFLSGRRVEVLDVTGGCPEMNPHFRSFVEAAHGLVKRLMVRTNLTILEEPGNAWIPRWYADNKVVLVASMPCYTPENVEAQRGRGVFGRSINALRRLNSLGYGDSLELDLVYNPGGPSLPGDQLELEDEYRANLEQGHGLRFNRLFTITNAPLGRFRKRLEASDELERYQALLADSFNPGTLEHIMCRTLISVGWDGTLYDCDFNQVAGLPIRNADGQAMGVGEMDDAICHGRQITVAEHCYCCTAGCGSSCTGVLG
jgi:radical SAM/Cys-rich protein